MFLFGFSGEEDAQSMDLYTSTAPSVGHRVAARLDMPNPGNYCCHAHATSMVTYTIAKVVGKILEATLVGEVF